MLVRNKKIATPAPKGPTIVVCANVKSPCRGATFLYKRESQKLLTLSTKLHA